MNEKEKEIDRWNQHLRNLSDNQYAKERELRRHRQLKDEIDNIHNQNNRLFQDIGSAWHRDRKMAVFLEDQRHVYQRQHFRVMEEMEDRQSQLDAERKALLDKEADYYEARRKLTVGGEQS
ncbi:DUF3958 family protein [Listeria booriae]|uniref:DUF3958 family protein n=1 Tax=Listeria booriae TaxID=1552123 RepID=UPI001623FABB|nr:DUF3958 family protein [Listeria booriae]MBC2320541.1 DUF3958 family protein [Listeria booriae]